MTLAPHSRQEECPPAYGGCTCSCHHNPNIYHVAPCCYPPNGFRVGGVKTMDVKDKVKKT